MTTQEVADKFYEYMQQGDFGGIYAELYSPDATSEEAPGPDWPKATGMMEIQQKGKKWNEIVKEMHGGTTAKPVVAGEYFTSFMTMDYTNNKDQRINMEEIGLYTVKNGKIISEQFFYYPFFMASTEKITMQMLIRKPIAEVFNAFIDPDVTTNFWFTKSSGKLEEGKEVIWEWEMYGVKSTIKVYKIVPDKLITISWGEPDGKVDFNFTQISNGTYVEVKFYDYPETGDALIKSVNNNTGGFTTALDGAKAWLEHGINLNLIADKFPAEIGK